MQMENNNEDLSGAKKLIFYMALYLAGVIGCTFGFLLNLILMMNFYNLVQQEESEKQKTDLSYMVKNAPALNVISITKNSDGTDNIATDFRDSEFNYSNKKLLEDVIKCGNLCYQRVIGKMNNSDYYNHALKAYKNDDGVNVDDSLKDSSELSSPETLNVRAFEHFMNKIVDTNDIARNAYLKDMSVIKEAAIICRDKPKLCENK